MRWQHCLDHADNIQKPEPTDSRLSETELPFVTLPDSFAHTNPVRDGLISTSLDASQSSRDGFQLNRSARK